MTYGATEKIDDHEAGHFTETNNNTNIDTSGKLPGHEHSSPASPVIGGIIVIATVAFIGLSFRSPSFSIYSSKGSLSEVMNIEVTNEYGDYMSQLFDYPFLEHALLLEPYRKTTFTITNSESDCDYDWSLTGDEFQAEGTSDSGAFESMAEKPGKYLLAINETCSSSITRELEQDVYVKYIRRELTSLTIKDREDFLDAFHTLWTTSTVDGQALYGERYKSAHYFATIHNDAGGNPLCDQFHGDVGFANNHLFLGQYLEQSLQLVNPKVALNYMDYSKYFSNGHYDGRKYLVDLNARTIDERCVNLL